MRVLILTSLLVAGTLGFAQAGADVKVTDVTVKDGLVTIRAASVPLADVLDRLQEQTGMKVIYDGPRPQQAIGVTIEGQTLTAAISTLLDAQGIKYAVALNSAGTQVATLLITTSGAPKAPVHAAAPTEAPPPFMGDENSYAMPPMPPPPVDAPPMTMPVGAPPMAMPGAGSPPPTTTGPSVSPFTPQGPGPIVIPAPGAAAPASGSATIATPPPPPPVMTPLPGPSTAERPPWEK
jgi:hypothetical protein